MKLLKKLKKDNKGFTLVEIIVVLVILAVLAAFTIPAMLGFVNEANQKAETAQARECYIAAQAIATEMMATGSSVADTTAVVEDEASTQMAAYLNGDVDGTIGDVVVSASGEITSLEYVGSNGFTITIAGGDITYEKTV
ncbi:type II secretion system protein [Acetobacterium sp.]|uniref:type II secretion system protein n=1 Tax=Acetobacterium sp. TaxID=1872094 RepID=UPI0035930F58